MIIFIICHKFQIEKNQKSKNKNQKSPKIQRRKNDKIEIIQIIKNSEVNFIEKQNPTKSQIMKIYVFDIFSFL